MMMKQSLLTCAAIAATLMAATPATAANFTVTFTGLVADGFTLRSVGSTTSTDLSGELFTATFLFNSAMGSLIAGSTGTAISGGSASATPSPATGATLTIGGISFPVLTGYADEASSHNDGIFSEQLFSATAETIDRSTYVDTILQFKLDGDSSIPATFTSFSGPIPTAVNSSSTAEYSLSSGNPGIGDFWIVYADLVPTYLTISAVPEPGSWAMMLVGFGVAGAALRRGKVTTRVRYVSHS